VSATVLFHYLPYAAAAVLVAGFLVRHVLWRRYLRVGGPPAPRLDLRVAGTVTAAALAVLLLAHLAALAVPRAFLLWNRVPLRLYLLEGTGLLVAVVALWGWLRLTVRHLRAPGASAAHLADSTLLALGLLALGSGLVTAVRYRWGSTWGAATLTPYVLSVLRGRPAGALAAQMPFPVQLHLVATFAVLALLPFGHLGQALVARADRAGRAVVGRAAAPLLAPARAARAWMARHHPAAWIWPDETEEAERAEQEMTR
jgi:nitrate reductase gamma subunit